MNEREYLGDAVYVQYDKYGNIILFTDTGEEITNSITLEPEVLSQFFKYVQRINTQWNSAPTN